MQSVNEKETEGIKSISDFIGELEKCIDKRKLSNDVAIVYRGEPEVYPTPAMPGVFRDKYITKKKYFEKNLLDEMKANRITKGITYLECAVDAQHDEFPSRLLDVTYNALVALYFAVTPYYKRYKEDAFDDDKDAKVIIFYLPKMYCPGAANIDDLFKDIIERKRDYLTLPLVQENYKLIDHVKMNTRICVQQGAFILFQGDEYTPISEKDYDTIIIPKSSRKKLREELNRYFGINTGFVYPEPYNLNATMGEKAYRLDNDDLNIGKEIDSFLVRIKEEINYSYVETLHKEDRALNSVIVIEDKLANYRNELIDFIKECEEDLRECFGKGEYKEVKKKYINRYNSLIDEYKDNFGMLCQKHSIGMSIDELMITEEK